MAGKDEPIYVTKRKALDSLAKKQSYRFRRLVEAEVRNIEERGVTTSGFAAAKYDELADLVGHVWDADSATYRSVMWTRDRVVAAIMTAVTAVVFVASLAEDETGVSGAVTAAAALAAVLFLVWDHTRSRPRELPEPGPLPRPFGPSD